MRYLLEDRQLTGKYKIVSCLFQERFYSKKNQGYLVKFIDILGEEREWVVKKFISSQDNLVRETEVLARLFMEGLPAPELIYSGKNYFIMTYIQGITLLAWLEKKEKEAQEDIMQVEVIKILEEMACWLKKFYQIFSGLYKSNLTLGDVNFRNFIVDHKLYGLDFESCRPGRVEEDVGKLCAFALTYTPSFTAWKLQLADSIKKIMSETLSVSIDNINLEMQKEVDQIIKRRVGRGDRSLVLPGE